MRIIHTADWHLGQRLVGRDRSEEHGRFFRWLLRTIRDEKVELLVVAGDIFDSAHPPQAVMQLYYDFLEELTALGSCGALLIGGNHDSPAHLNAPRQLLERFRIHVVGAASPEREKDIIHYVSPSDASDSICLCAVPYLRDRDIQQIVVGEAPGQREERLREGIYHYYYDMRRRVQPYRDRKIPVLATGHLTMQAKGAETNAADADAEDHEIHIGTLAALEETRLPNDFDYLALGHLHRPHAVGKGPSVRYAGSPFPMSFSEAHHEKTIMLLEFREGALTQCETRAIPHARRLYRYTGTLSTLGSWLDSLSLEHEPLEPWLELHLSSDEREPRLGERAAEIASPYPIDLLKVLSAGESLDSNTTWQSKTASLEELAPDDVFRQRLLAAQIDPEAVEGVEVRETFTELLSLHEAQSLELDSLNPCAARDGSASAGN